MNNTMILRGVARDASSRDTRTVFDLLDNTPVSPPWEFE